MAVHPPAMGGKTAWGVSEVISRPTDDPEDIVKMRKLQADFSEREHERLNRLKALDNSAAEILEARKARRLEYQPASTNGDGFKKRQDEILRKMHEAKERRRQERQEKKRGAARPAKVKKRQRNSEASDSADGSESSSDSSASLASRPSSDSAGRAKRRALDEAEAGAAPQGGEAQQPEAKRRAEELKARERELRRKAKEQAAAWAAEAKRREAELEARRQAEAKRRAEEAEAKRQAEAKRKAEEEARRKAEEAEAKQKSAGSEARRKLFQIEKRRAGFDDTARRERVAGGFYKGQRVVATQDITVRGAPVVKAGAAGTVVGPSESDPTGRIAVRFLQREDTALGNLNVVPREIKKG